MDARHYLTCLWPGMAELWWRGRLSALPAAIGFGVLVNGLLITRFLYPEWLSGVLVRVACWVGLVAWAVGAFRAIQELPGLLSPRSVSDQPDRFPEAQVLYLGGEWDRAEELLRGILEVEPRDPPAMLLLAGVYRHRGRLDEAEEWLRRLALLEAADPWWLEREAEGRRLSRAREAAEESAASEGHEQAGASEAGASQAGASEAADESGPTHPSREGVAEAA